MKIHSLSSTITNSSTTVYCYAKDEGKQFIKDIVNQVLKDGGSNKTFDDLYDIRIEYDDSVYERLYDDWADDEQTSFGDEVPDFDSYEEGAKWVKQYCLKHNLNLVDEFEDDDYNKNYVIVPKNGSSTEVFDKINELFDHEGIYG